MTAVLVAALLALTMSVAAAGDGLAISSDKVYSPQPDTGSVTVAATFVLTNVKPTEYYDTYTRSYWFEAFSFAVLAEATDLNATADGRALTVTREAIPDETTFEIVDIRLPRNLNFQQTITLEVSWTLPSGEVRDDAIVRVSPSYITFPIIACCDPGTTNVQVDIPAGFDIELYGERGDELNVVTDGAERRLEAREIEDPGEFVATMFARNDEGLVAEIVQFGPGTAEVRSWPDDPAWAEFVAETIEEDLPILEGLIGEPWPLDETLVVVETVSPYLEGYGGTYSDGVIEIGENLDEKIVLHELSHAWLNGTLSEERWIIEGLAEEFASRTLATTNPAADADQLHPARPDPTDDVAVPLQEWPYAAQLHGRDDQPEFEAYHYNAAWWVMREVSDEIGVDGLSDVVEALMERETPFVGEGDIEIMNGPIDAGRFLDTVEWRAGSESAQQLLVDHVFDQDTAADLLERKAAHEAYQRLVDQAGTWAPPLGIRERLTEWDFATASELTELASAALDDRDRVARMAADFGISLSDENEERFEAARFASDFTNLSSFAADERDGLTAIDERRGQIMASAADLGTTTPAWTNPATADIATMELDAHEATLGVLADASGIVDGDRSFFTRVGLIGADPVVELQAAQNAFAAGDQAVAGERSMAASEIVTAAEDRGRTRVLVAAVAASALVGLGLALSVVARRRRRGRRSAG